MEIRQTSYLRKSLMKGEEAKVEAYLHWMKYLSAWALLALGFALLLLAVVESLCLLAAPIFLIWGGIRWLRVNCTQMLITTKRVIFKEGIISTHTEEIRNAKVESIEIRQSIMGRLLGYATIHFSGTGNSDVYFCDIADPWTIKNSAELIVNDEYT